MKEILPVGQGYSKSIIDVIDLGIMLDGKEIGQDFGFESTEDMIKTFPVNSKVWAVPHILRTYSEID